MLLGALNSPLMQRLRRIKQCGFADYVYPSLSHNRFEHSLGCYHVMKRYLNRLSELAGETTPSDVPSPDTISTYLREDVGDILGKSWPLRFKAAALLHDCGHTAFSHATETLLPPGTGQMKPHEQWGVRLVRENLAELDNDLAQEVATLLRHCYSSAGGTPVIAAQLLASAVDCDRLDYLSRDAHHSGVHYGKVDLDWILRAMELSYFSSPAGTVPVVAYHDRRGLWALDQLLSARRTMYLQVYLHRVVHAVGFMYQRIIQRAIDLGVNGAALAGPIAVLRKLREAPESVSADEYLSVDDLSVIAQLTTWSNGDELGIDELLQGLCKSFLDRKLFVDTSEYHFDVHA